MDMRDSLIAIYRICEIIFIYGDQLNVGGCVACVGISLEWVHSHSCLCSTLCRRISCIDTMRRRLNLIQQVSCSLSTRHTIKDYNLLNTEQFNYKSVLNDSFCMCGTINQVIVGSAVYTTLVDF
jgi:hypothetical protein